ncbi:MAG: 50S ribosomal protein L10 [Gammaproteobacteria bacterium]
MPLRLEEKKVLVSEVNAVAAQALSCVGAEYRGLTVEQLDSLRKQARALNVYVRVVKNTLARRAVEGTDFECLKPALKGPLVLAFSNEDPGAAARIFRDFAKEHEKLTVTALAIGGQLLPASDLGRVASLPTREEALTQLAVVVQAPITKLVRTLAEPHAKMVRTFGAVRDQKQAA